MLPPEGLHILANRKWSQTRQDAEMDSADSQNWGPGSERDRQWQTKKWRTKNRWQLKGHDRQLHSVKSSRWKKRSNKVETKKWAKQEREKKREQLQNSTKKNPSQITAFHCQQICHFLACHVVYLCSCRIFISAFPCLRKFDATFLGN